MNVLHLSETPVAGAPYFWSECMNKYSKGQIKSRCFSEGWWYTDGREFPHDIESREESQDLLAWADVILVHDRPPTNMGLPFEKVLLVCHGPPSNMHPVLLETRPKAVIAQAWARLYPGADLLPNLIDLEFYKCAQRESDSIRIGYSPSKEREEPLYSPKWYGNKGCRKTIEILEASKVPYSVFTRMPWAALVDQARKYDVWIDECVTGGYHRASLQATAMSQVALNRMNSETRETMQKVSGTMSHPFVSMGLKNLEAYLRMLGRNAGAARLCGRTARKWMENYWNPEKLITRCFIPFLRKSG